MFFFSMGKYPDLLLYKIVGRYLPCPPNETTPKTFSLYSFSGQIFSIVLYVYESDFATKYI